MRACSRLDGPENKAEVVAHVGPSNEVEVAVMEPQEMAHGMEPGAGLEGGSECDEGWVVHGEACAHQANLLELPSERLSPGVHEVDFIHTECDNSCLICLVLQQGLEARGHELLRAQEKHLNIGSPVPDVERWLGKHGLARSFLVDHQA